jgi:DNA-binding transcriptional regulator YdaS (Cro superfamily)
MKLDKYLEQEKVTASAWAKKVGIPQPVLSRFISGERGVSLKTALLIQEKTGGQVRVEDLSPVAKPQAANNA